MKTTSKTKEVRVYLDLETGERFRKLRKELGLTNDKLMMKLLQEQKAKKP